MKKKLLTIILIGALTITSFICGTLANKQEQLNDTNYIDMSQVISYEATETGIQLHFMDGTGYYLENK